MQPQEIEALKAFRRTLHRYPEVSGNETKTAQMIEEFFKSLNPDKVIRGLGGTGLAFIYQGQNAGPTSLFRCELDGLPIQEEGDIIHKSKEPGKSHVCGHDGHMAIVTGLGMLLSRRKPLKGEVVLLFQPAEETGEGAKAVLEDPQFVQIKPDYAFALHNLPGFPKHSILMKDGPFAAASIGMIITFKGRNSHSAHPEAGRSPALALSETIRMLEDLPSKQVNFSLVTVVHAALGEINFGTTPGEAIVCATLRAFKNEDRDQLVEKAQQLVKDIARQYQLGFETSFTESFAASDNHSEAYSLGLKAAEALQLNVKFPDQPFRWSEDFGLFSAYTKTLLFGLGSGEDQPQLHEPNFDFPDEITPTGIKMFSNIVEQLHY
jgi:amidohydrolase